MEQSLSSRMMMIQNPFTFKVGQVFTGFGVGCGIGIGVGRPINLGAIPMMHQVMSAARGATDVASGIGGHVNRSLKRLGAKDIEAGIGCGVGFGHGFGIGIALKPGVINQLEASAGKVIAKMMNHLGVNSGLPGLPLNQLGLPSGIFSGQGSTTQLEKKNSNNVDISFRGSEVSRGSFLASVPEGAGPKSLIGEQGMSMATSMATRTDKVINSFLKNPALRGEKETELNELVAKLQSENHILHVLLKHQEMIEELVNENEKMRQVLLHELKVSPDKLTAHNSSNTKTGASKACINCFDCRRRERISRR